MQKFPVLQIIGQPIKLPHAIPSNTLPSYQVLHDYTVEPHLTDATQQWIPMI